MGFSKQQAEAGIKQYGTVQSALDSLLAGVGELQHTEMFISCFPLPYISKHLSDIVFYLGQIVTHYVIYELMMFVPNVFG